MMTKRLLIVAAYLAVFTMPVIGVMLDTQAQQKPFPPPPQATIPSESIFVGTLLPWTVVNLLPANYAFADGQTVKVTDYPELFRLIGNKYGGDGKTEFKLPDGFALFGIKDKEAIRFIIKVR